MVVKLFPSAAFPWIRRHHRQVTALGLLVALVATSLGLAVPVIVRKVIDEPFPCMHSSCGCLNAETCWRSCCCHTTAEKLAWAREYGVTPPDYVLAEARKPACCQKKVARASCCSGAKVATCCRSEGSCGERVMTWRTARETGKREFTRIVLSDALRCQGLGSSWTLLPPTVVPPPIAMDDAPAGLTECVASVEESFTGYLPPPDVPPPKNAASC